jgi:hypothetical protein
MSDVRITATMHGASNVARLLSRHPEKIGRTLESLVKQEARGMAVELARHTRPFGFGESAKARGEKAVRADIHRVYKPPAEAYEQMKKVDPALADRFWAAVTNRRFVKANKVMQDSSSPMHGVSMGRLDPSLHKSARTGPHANVPRRTKPSQIVTSQTAIDSYAKKKLRMVGFAKASWINCAKAIGGRVRGAAQWATRHKKAPGTATVKTGANPSVTLINSLWYIDQVCPVSSVEMALKSASERLRKALAHSMAAIANRTNAALRRRAG